MNKETLEHWMKAAWKQSENARCVKKKVGAILVTIHGNEVSTGYGGPEIRIKCELNSEGLCPRKYMQWSQDGCWALHAEQRALFNCISKYGGVNGKSIMFVTHGPCDQCLKFMHYFGVETVVYDVEYKTDYSKWEGKIKIVQLEKFKVEL